MKNNRKVEKGQVWAMEGDMEELYVVLNVDAYNVKILCLADRHKVIWGRDYLEKDVFVM